MYLYGVDPAAPTDKLYEIEKVFAANLPVDPQTGSRLSYGVLRNEVVVIFVPERFPHRRLQVFLKLWSNPMSVLLNIGLDQIALGYNGEDVLMLPRAARALVTGYTTWTMDLTHLETLSHRQLAQDQYLFKYAEQGYGLRILPSYMDTLSETPVSVRTTMEPNVDESMLPRDPLNVFLREERARIAWWIASKNETFLLPFEDRLDAFKESMSSDFEDIEASEHQSRMPSATA